MAATGQWNDTGFTSLKEGIQLRSEIVSNHITSAYYPYALLSSITSAGKEIIAPFVDAADRFPNSPESPLLVAWAASAAIKAAGQSREQNDREGEAQYYALADKLYQRALKSGSLAVRDDATHGLSLVANYRENIHAAAK
jgi:hypothetical protein